MNRHTRRDMAKIVAAAAAGSVAGKVATERDLVDAMRQALQSLPEPTPETARYMAEQRKRDDFMYRLRHAIELGDRTAEELPEETIFGLTRIPDEGTKEVVWRSWFNTPGIFGISFAQDPDPLTAVQKAREAALEWNRTHFVEMRWDGSVRRPSGEWDEPGPKPGLPDTTWRRLTIRGSGKTP